MKTFPLSELYGDLPSNYWDSESSEEEGSEDLEARAYRQEILDELETSQYYREQWEITSNLWRQDMINQFMIHSIQETTDTIVDYLQGYHNFRG